MPSMSPRKNAPKHISIPARLHQLTRSTSSNSLSDNESLPVTPGPSTPLPFVVSSFNLGQNESCKNKRSREEEPEDVDWIEEDTLICQATIRRPVRPLSAPYPPGELPPATIIDEITLQVTSRQEWPHGFHVTRKRVYALLLDESRQSHGIPQASRAERKQRPGMKRMDSMDFLEQAANQGNPKTAIKLSTYLQNSAKQADKPNPDQVTPPALATPDALTLPTIARPELTRRASRQALKPSRPSLLQRGKSFTAADLAANSVDLDSSPHHKPPKLVRSQSTQIPSPTAREFSTSLGAALTVTAAKQTPGEWSESEDEGAPRVIVKRNKPSQILRKPRLIVGEDLCSGGLRSPFEEKSFDL